MSDILLKFKIVRDLKKIKKFNKLHFNSYLYKIEKNTSYINLLYLIENNWNNSGNFNTQIKLSDLNKINLNFLKKISILPDIIITRLPIFNHFYIENSEIKSKIISVNYITKNSIYDYILDRQYKYNFYIYSITEKEARLYEDEDINRLRKNRKEKLDKLKNVAQV